MEHMLGLPEDGCTKSVEGQVRARNATTNVRKIFRCADKAHLALLNMRSWLQFVEGTVSGGYDATEGNLLYCDEG